MATRTWDGGDDGLFWDTPGNWVEGVVPVAGDSVYLTTAVAPADGPAAPISFALFDTSALGANLDAAVTTNITIANNGTLILGADGAIGHIHIWDGAVGTGVTAYLYDSCLNLDTGSLFNTGSEAHFYNSAKSYGIPAVKNYLHSAGAKITGGDLTGLQVWCMANVAQGNITDTDAAITLHDTHFHVYGGLWIADAGTRIFQMDDIYIYLYTPKTIGQSSAGSGVRIDCLEALAGSFYGNPITIETRLWEVME